MAQANFLPVKRLLLSSKRPLLFAMVHLKALPGTPLNKHTLQEISDKACEVATLLVNSGVDGLVVENMHDVPYVKSDQMGPEITACMTAVCSRIKQEVPSEMPLGVQVLAAANKQALAVALASGFDFIRAECFAFSHVADEGWMDACAGALLRYRKNIGGTNVAVFTDIKKKHSAHAVTADVGIAETAQAADFFLADGVILTGAATGVQASPLELTAVRNATEIPVMVGSGVTRENMHDYKSAHAFIVGSHFKKDGCWANNLDKDRIKLFVDALHKL